MNDFRENLERVSAETGLSLLEVASMAELMASIEIDPIIAAGEVFRFPAEMNPMVYCRDDRWINPVVPEPYAMVNLFVAHREFARDVLRGRAILAGGPSLEEAAAVHRNLKEWMRFWAVRHLSPKMRARLAAEDQAAAKQERHVAQRAAELFQRKLEGSK
jgi:hypothetical protein